MSEQLDLLAELSAALCTYGSAGPGGLCRELATHAAVATVESGPSAGHVARVECCLPHANYYARGWLGPHLLYPGVRGAVWLEAVGG